MNPISYKKVSPLVMVFLLTLIYIGSVSGQKKTTFHERFRLKFLSEYIIPYNFLFENTTVGGLSGIDYQPAKKEYYAISDDRSSINPARFYTFKVEIRNDKIDTIVFTNTTYLKNSEGNKFPPSTLQKATIDPEALRSWNSKFIWSSEGDRILKNNRTVLLNPEIYISDENGNFMDTFHLPPQVRVSATNRGVRQNGGFEGVAISPDGKYLFASVEEPLLQDGPRAGLGDSTGIIRIIKFSLKTKKPVAQYAYKIDAVAYPVFPPNAFRVNGISDILCLSNNKLLVVERSYSTGRLSCTIKTYIADLAKADDVSKFKSLKGKKYKIASKKLVLNFDSLDIFIDNIEGVTFGPKLSNGNPSLLFIADNNFNSLEKSQVLLFEIQNPEQK